MFHHVHLAGLSVLLDRVHADAKHFSGEDFSRLQHAGPIAHTSSINGEARGRLVDKNERKTPSSIGSELRWLALFLLIFSVTTFLLLTLLVPHHFNDRIAITLSAIAAGVIWMIVRANAARRA